MPRLLYTVRVSCNDLQQRGRFLSWLVPSHVEAVKAAGAKAVRVNLYEADPVASPGSPASRPAVENEYVFPSRKAFEVYLRDHAPALRADGLKHFPPESGVTFERKLGEVAYES
jgi:hypothetical protein